MKMGEYLKSMVYTRKEVDDWFSGMAFPFSRYDSELGYLLRSARFKDGVDGSMSTYNYNDHGLGPRRMIRYAGTPCRINTYGNSFTQCQQVSDGETWQEVLTAHLCEPIRNFGVGGHSVYQAYLRMKREEMKTPAEYIVFNIYDDDHYRSLVSWQGGKAGAEQYTFHICPTSPYVKVNPTTGEFVKRKNLCPTPESFYNLCNADWVYETFKDDFTLKIKWAQANVKEGTPEESYSTIVGLARTHGIKTCVDSVETMLKTLNTLYTKAAIFASMRIVEKIEKFADTNGKKVLYVLSFCSDNIARKIEDGHRFDQEFVDFLQRKGLPYVDMMEAHIADYAQFKTGVKDYLKRYYIGHYNPLGNFFLAFAIKGRLVKMLRPKPISYEWNVPNYNYIAPFGRDRSIFSISGSPWHTSTR